jgi:hypothetical protein
MADILLFPPKKTDANYKWFIHQCIASEFFLRDDGVIVCPKCGEEIGFYTLNGDNDPKRPV